MPPAAIPWYSRSRMRPIRSMDRFALIARRSSSDSAGVNPAMSMAICMSCSWNSGTPRVRDSVARSRSCGGSGSSRLLARRMYGCTEPPWIGPGRISATSTTRS